MDTALDYDILAGRLNAVEGVLRSVKRLPRDMANKALALSALSRSEEMLELVYGHVERDVDRSHAFAYALNQGFVQGALFLWSKGALEDARGWMAESAEFKRYKMRYLLMKGNLFVDAGTDFFGYILRIYSLENMLGARGVPLADSQMRCEALGALASAGALSPEMYYEYAFRAIVFDECEFIDAMDASGGFSFARAFGGEAQSMKNHLVHSGISARKVELVASIMPSGYKFPLDARHLEDADAACALVRRASKETCTRPDLLVGFLIAKGRSEELAMVVDWGGVNAGNIAEFMEQARDHGDTKSLALLLEYKRRHLDADPFGALEI